jgi:hypothetical protein
MNVTVFDTDNFRFYKYFVNDLGNMAHFVLFYQKKQLFLKNNLQLEVTCCSGSQYVKPLT